MAEINKSKMMDTTATTTTGTETETATKSGRKSVRKSVKKSLKAETAKTNETSSSDDDSPKVSTLMYLAVVSALMGGLGFGFVIGWTSPAIESMMKSNIAVDIVDNTAYLSWIGSSMTLGALLGSLASGVISQKFGRKKALVFYSVPYTLGWLVITLAPKIIVIIIGRVILGISTGLVSGTVPMYICEITTVSNRGLFGACFQLSITIGILLAYTIGAFIPWRIFSGASLIPTFLMGIFMMFMPETPSWLLMVNQEDEAKNQLNRLRSNVDNQKEFDQIKQQILSSNSDQDNGFKKQFEMLFKRQHSGPFYRSIGLMFFQQFSGINAVMFYSSQILSTSSSAIPNYLGTIMIGGAQVLATGSGALLIHRFGRKTLLSFSGALHIISLVVLGAYFTLTLKMNEKIKLYKIFGFIPTISLVVFIIGFSTGWGPIPWLMVAEMTSLESRSIISSISTMVNWLGAFLVTKNFETLVNLISEQGAYFLFAGFSFLSILFVTIYLPETRNKSAEEIKAYFD